MRHWDEVEEGDARLFGRSRTRTMIAVHELIGDVSLEDWPWRSGECSSFSSVASECVEIMEWAKAVFEYFLLTSLGNTFSSRR